MTKKEWLTSTDPQALLAFLQASRTGSGRKLRLFACACCRCLWGDLVDKTSQQAVEMAESFADGEVIRTMTRDVMTHAAAAVALGLADIDSREHKAALVAATVLFGRLDPWRGTSRVVWQALAVLPGHTIADLLRDQFTTVRVPLDVLTPTVVSLAEAAYDDRILPAGQLDPVRLAIVADALEEAGSTAAVLLEHLRGPGPHIRGCWAVDLLLGKE
jgi:hypothetical protein